MASDNAKSLEGELATTNNRLIQSEGIFLLHLCYFAVSLI